MPPATSHRRPELPSAAPAILSEANATSLRAPPKRVRVPYSTARSTERDVRAGSFVNCSALARRKSTVHPSCEQLERDASHLGGGGDCDRRRPRRRRGHRPRGDRREAQKEDVPSANARPDESLAAQRIGGPPECVRSNGRRRCAKADCGYASCGVAGHSARSFSAGRTQQESAPSPLPNARYAAAGRLPSVERNPEVYLCDSRGAVPRY